MQVTYVAYHFYLEELEKVLTGNATSSLQVVSEHCIVKKMDNQNVSTPCMKRLCSVGRNSSNDQISQLPDDILVSILSLVNLKEAVSTSILSRRWRHLWTYRTGCFDFDISGKMDNLKQMERRMRLEEISRYIGWVHRVIQLHSSSHVDEVRIAPVLNSRQWGELYQWVHFAMKKGAKKLEVDFKNHLVLSGGPIILPKIEGFTHFSDITNARSMQCLLCPRGVMEEVCHSHFRFCLKSLSLRNISVSEEALNLFLSNYVALEHLCVENSNLLVHVKITGSRLKYLEIMHCANLEQLVISSENLLSFTYDGPFIDVPFQDVNPQLVELVVDQEYSVSLLLTTYRHITYVSQLETLKCVVTDWFSTWVCSYGHPFSEMKNLKHLELELHVGSLHNMWSYVAVVRATPLLSSLKLKITSMVQAGCWYRVAYRRPNNPKSFSHYNLKEIEIVGFRALIDDISLASDLLDAALVLKKMVLQFGAGKSTPRAIARVGKLTEKLRPGSKLVISEDPIQTYWECDYYV